MRVVSILPPLAGMKLSVNVGPPLRLILDKLTFTNSRLMLRESFLPVTEDGSSSTVTKKKSQNAPLINCRPPRPAFAFPFPYLTAQSPEGGL